MIVSNEMGHFKVCVCCNLDGHYIWDHVVEVVLCTYLSLERVLCKCTREMIVITESLICLQKYGYCLYTKKHFKFW